MTVKVMPTPRWLTALTNSALLPPRLFPGAAEGSLRGARCRRAQSSAVFRVHREWCSLCASPPMNGARRGCRRE